MTAQQWETEGLAAMTRPHWATRLMMRVVRWVERLNRRQAKLGERQTFSAIDFPWVRGIEADWRSIRSELDRVLVRRSELPNVQDITLDAASITNDDGWKVFLFFAYGVKSQRNCDLCPDTWRIVQRIPGLRTAMFSILEPGKRVPAHRGPYNGVLRLHLGLRVPEPNEATGIRIDREVHHWSEGQALIFDDAFEHAVWNETSRERVVLFVDFAKPLFFPASWVNACVLRLAYFTPFLREGDRNLRRWEQRFYR